MPTPVKVFVAARGNGFMRDIASWLVEAAHLAGHDAELVDHRLPVADGSINLVVAPHEFFVLTQATAAELERGAAASVCVCTEQPGTAWFDIALRFCRLGLRALDINRQGVQALRAAGVDAHHLMLGAVPSMQLTSAGHGLEQARRHDLLFMGGLDERRGAILAALAPRLWNVEAELRLFRFDRPITAETRGVVFGADKYRLLADSRILLNVHRARSGALGTYFEWARAVEAMAAGCVVISEPADDHAPLVAGQHFIAAQAHELGDAIVDLLAQPDRLTAIADAARNLITGPLALATTIAPHLDELERAVLPRIAAHVAQARTRRPPPQRTAPSPRAPFQPFLAIHRDAKRLALAETAALRRLDAARCVLRYGTPQHLVTVSTPAYTSLTQPDVSVVVPLYDQADMVPATLDSIVASRDVQFEVIVVDDHANDASRAVVEAYLTAHPDVPMLLVGKECNEGLSAARNTGFEHARAPLVMAVDADNQVYPTCLARLARALHDDPAAAAAYSILEDFGGSTGLRSAVAWDVGRLCAANYIDAQAMWRRAEWQQLGGYDSTIDFTIGGWEDWDLWLRLAATGGHACLVAQILGRYRVQAGSMVALTNLAGDDAVAALRARYPSLPWPL